MTVEGGDGHDNTDEEKIGPNSIGAVPGSSWNWWYRPLAIAQPNPKGRIMPAAETLSAVLLQLLTRKRRHVGGAVKESIFNLLERHCKTLYYTIYLTMYYEHLWLKRYKLFFKMEYRDAPLVWAHRSLGKYVTRVAVWDFAYRTNYIPIYPVVNPKS